MFLKKILNILFLLVSSNISIAQLNDSIYSNDSEHYINVNILGDVSFFSLNYERIINTKENVFHSVKFGIGYNEDFTLFGDPKSYICFPHHYTLNFGRKVANF